MWLNQFNRNQLKQRKQTLPNNNQTNQITLKEIINNHRFNQMYNLSNRIVECFYVIVIGKKMIRMYKQL